MNKTGPKCCHLSCDSRAEFTIYGEPSHPEDCTEACEKHVGALIGTPEWKSTDNTHWTVVPLSNTLDTTPAEGAGD